jgi:hypothetical protein
MGQERGNSCIDYHASTFRLDATTIEAPIARETDRNRSKRDQRSCFANRPSPVVL